MKLLVFAFSMLLSYTFVGAQSEESPVEYPIRDLDINGEQLKRVHKAVLESISSAHMREIKESSLNVRILQLVHDRGYLCSADGTTILIETSSTQYADGDDVSVCLEATGGFYEYTTVLGAGKRVHVFRQLKEASLPDFGEFYELVKRGKAYVITQGERIIKCQDCGGFGKGSMIDGRYVPCPGCNDRGRWKKPNFYRVIW